jgi:20S proteasome alpha/beta subunit
MLTQDYSLYKSEGSADASRPRGETCPKPPFPRPNPARLPQRKRMTIALGLRANDGIVLCADSQKTISGYIKTYDGKVDLHGYRDPRVIVAIAGAGTEDYIDTAQLMLLNDFDDELKQRGNLHGSIPIVLKERFLKFFDEHLARWAYFPERERPTTELLIGVTGQRTWPRIFHCDGTAFREVSQKAIGDGVLIADQLLNQYGFGDFTVAQLASLAVYILRKVKERVDGCGGETHVIGLRKGFDFALTDHKDIKEMERRFEELDKITDKSMTKSIVEIPLSLSWHSEHRKRK